MNRPYTLSCHCGNIRFEVDAELENLGEGNCSTCVRFGMLSWYVPIKAVRLLAEKRVLSAYTWHHLSGGWKFCPICGATIAFTGYPGGIINVNARCTEGIDIFELKVARGDCRKNLPPGPREARSKNRPYALSCHCGNVRFEVDSELENLGEGNCSTCRRFGMLSWKVPIKAVRLLTEKPILSTYTWRDLHGGWKFCPTCGATVALTGYPGGIINVNARCIEGIDIFELKVTRGDCRNSMPPGPVR